MIAISCPTCSAAIRLADEFAGGKCLCPQCRQRIQIPMPARIGKTAIAHDSEPPPIPTRRLAFAQTEDIVDVEVVPDEPPDCIEPRPWWCYISACLTACAILTILLPYTAIGDSISTPIWQSGFQVAIGGAWSDPPNATLVFLPGSSGLVAAFLCLLFAAIVAIALRPCWQRTLLASVAFVLFFVLLCWQVTSGLPLQTEWATKRDFYLTGVYWRNAHLATIQFSLGYYLLWVLTVAAMATLILEQIMSLRNHSSH